MSWQMRAHDRLLRERVRRSRFTLVTGPRMVGLTTSCQALAHHCIDWRDPADGLLLLQGADAVARQFALPTEREITVVLENVPLQRDARTWARRLLSRGGPNLHLVVTSNQCMPSALRLHPWGVGECAGGTIPEGSPLRTSAPISDVDWSALLDHGGFPEPFRKREPRFTRRWLLHRQHEMLEYDLPRLAATRDPQKLQALALILSRVSATALNYSSLASQLNATVDTVTRWIGLLTHIQLGFCIRPWFHRVPRAIRSEPKWFLRDWSAVTEPQARQRTFVACQLLRAVDCWTEMALGRFQIRYLRDKARREVDFLILRNGRPWFMVELGADRSVSAAAHHFQRHTGAQHAMHVVMDRAYAGVNAFEAPSTAVGARDLLSQLP